MDEELCILFSFDLVFERPRESHLVKDIFGQVDLKKDLEFSLHDVSHHKKPPVHSCGTNSNNENL